MSALQGFILLRDEYIGTWLLHCLMTFVVLERMRGEALVSQILLIPEFLRAHPAFIILPLESMCEPLSPLVLFTLAPQERFAAFLSHSQCRLLWWHRSFAWAKAGGSCMCAVLSGLSFP